MKFYTKNSINPILLYLIHLVPGEGEHKILQYIKTNKIKLSKQSNCIYGLDADLIMLSLLSGIKMYVFVKRKNII